MAYEKRYRSRHRARKGEASRATSICIFTLAFILLLLNRDRLFKLSQKDTSIVFDFFQQGRTLFLMISAIVLFVAVGLTIKYIFSNDYLPNNMGYLFHPFKGYQHRRIAETYIGRRLKRNEEVHHINGNANDNEKGNLCVLSKKNHVQYHKWLRKEKARLGKYPSIQAQKATLSRLGGRVL